jgi:hypothetical protein
MRLNKVRPEFSRVFWIELDFNAAFLCLILIGSDPSLRQCFEFISKAVVAL